MEKTTVSPATRVLLQRIVICGVAAILTAYVADWWVDASSQHRNHLVFAGFAGLAAYSAIMRFRIRLSTAMLIMAIVAALYGYRNNRLYKFISERDATMGAMELGAKFECIGHPHPFGRREQPRDVSDLVRLKQKKKTYAYQLTAKQRQRIDNRLLRAPLTVEVAGVTLTEPFDIREMARHLNAMPALRYVTFGSRCDDASLQLVKELRCQTLAFSICLDSISPSGLEAAFPSTQKIEMLWVSTSEQFRLADLGCLRNANIESLCVSVVYGGDVQLPVEDFFGRVAAQDFQALTKLASLKRLYVSIPPYMAPVELDGIVAEMSRDYTLRGPRMLTEDESEVLLPAEFRDQLTDVKLALDPRADLQKIMRMGNG